MFLQRLNRSLESSNRFIKFSDWNLPSVDFLSQTNEAAKLMGTIWILLVIEIIWWSERGNFKKILLLPFIVIFPKTKLMDFTKSPLVTYEPFPWLPILITFHVLLTNIKDFLISYPRTRNHWKKKLFERKNHLILISSSKVSPKLLVIKHTSVKICIHLGEEIFRGENIYFLSFI